MNPLRWSYRVSFFAGFVFSAGLVAFTLYAQYKLGMDACPLCILQRFMMMVLAVLFLLGALHAPSGAGRWVYISLVVVAALTGGGISARHLWIQSLPPDQVPSCGVPLGYLLKTSDHQGGLIKVLIKVLSGSGQCARVQEILGVPMPCWALICFILLASWSLHAGIRRVT